MPIPRRSQVVRATRDTPWQFSNQVLYDLCHDHPRHVAMGVVLAKILLVGRAYAAAIERGRTVGNEKYNFYTSSVAPKMMDSPLDAWIAEAKAGHHSDAGTLQVMVKIHGLTTGLFHSISELENRSLASKYLHFHVPHMFFIYDYRAVEAMRVLSPVVGRASRFTGRGDGAYSKFAEKCSRLTTHCEAEFGIHLTPRQLDNLLLSLHESKT